MSWAFPRSPPGVTPLVARVQAGVGRRSRVVRFVGARASGAFRAAPLPTPWSIWFPPWLGAVVVKSGLLAPGHWASLSNASANALIDLALPWLGAVVVKSGGGNPRGCSGAARLNATVVTLLALVPGTKEKGEGASWVKGGKKESIWRLDMTLGVVRMGFGMVVEQDWCYWGLLFVLHGAHQLSVPLLGDHAFVSVLQLSGWPVFRFTSCSVRSH